MKKVLALILAALLIFGGALAEEAAGNLWLTDPELMFQLNRSELEGLGDIEGKVYVFGHKSPDTDTVCCAIAYASLLKQLGYDAEAMILEKVNAETAYVLKEAGVDTPPILEDASGLNVILIDHADYAQSVPGLENAKILTIIDHHGAGTVSTGNQIIYDSRPMGATATIIWMRYMNYGLTMDQTTAKLLLGALLSDTTNMAAGGTKADYAALKELCALSGVEDRDAFFREMYKASISYEGMTDDEIFTGDMKTYESAGTQFMIGCVNAYDDEIARDLAERMKAVMPAQVASAGVNMAFAQISIFHDGISIVYLVPSDDVAAEVVREAFGEEGKFDGTSFIFEPGFSRRKVLVPKLSDALAMHPGE